MLEVLLRNGVIQNCLKKDKKIKNNSIIKILFIEKSLK